ncbi:MAG: trigger factor family protein, partial [Patescibacteria group bacterium]
MELEIKQLPKSEVEIIGEISAERFSKFWPKAIKNLSEGVSMHGFRKGNIPEKVLVDKVGESAVLEKAAEMALQDVYSEILMKKKIEAIGTPKATVTKIAKNNPLGFKFQTAVLPTIQLPEDYRELAARIINPPAGGEEIKVE